jgi:hypothetical protein
VWRTIIAAIHSGSKQRLAAFGDKIIERCGASVLSILTNPSIIASSKSFGEGNGFARLPSLPVGATSRYPLKFQY